jgi:hypothetical protein
VVDRSVLAPGTHALEADQKRAPPIRVEELLESAQLLPVVLDLLGRFGVALVVALELRINASELHLAPDCHPETLEVLHFLPDS